MEEWVKCKGGDRVRHIRGSGGAVGGGGKGGGGSARNPVEEPNSLRSTAYAKALFVIGEGQVEGPPDGLLQNIYLDKTPIQSPNGQSNFSGYAIEWRNGTPDQEYIPGFSKAEIETQVGVQVRNSLPVTRTITSPEMEAVRVRIRVPALRRVTNDGDIYGSSASLQILISENGGPFDIKVSDTISGKCTSPYERSYEILLEGSPPWDIRVVRTSADSTDSRIENSFFWQAYTAIDYDPRRYPDTALLGIRIDAQQFSSMPQVAVKIRGMRILVPHNYDPISREYDGMFDGSLVPAWTDNPAWILHDLLTDDRYGAGLNPDSMDIYSFYEAGQYCDELVPNGEQGFEPRWRFSAYIDQREEAYKMIEAVAASFNAMVYWAEGSVRLVLDKLSSPVRIYNQANVVVEYNETGQMTKPPFDYSTTSLTTRHSVAVVSYQEPNEFYEVRQVYVEDEESLERLGYRPVDITAFGCTSRTQAQRYGRWRLLTEKLQTETVRYVVAQEGLLVRPGEVIAIADPVRAGERLGGRVQSATATQVYLDASITLAPDKDYEILTIAANGKAQTHSILVNVSEPTAVSNVAIAGEFASGSIPATDAVWVIRSTTVELAQYRVVNVKEKDGAYEIEALEYQPGKYAAIEDGVEFVELDISDLDDPAKPPPPPTDLRVDESLFVTTGSSGVRVKTDVSWGYDDGSEIDRFQVEYRRDEDTDFVVAGVAYGRLFSIQDLTPGIYEFRVAALSLLGVRGTYTAITRTVYGLLEPPVDVENFRHRLMGDLVQLSWARSPDLDVRIGGRFLIKHTPNKAGVEWTEGVLVADMPGSATEVTLPALDGTYQIKARDSAGNQSVNEATLIFNEQPPTGRQQIAAIAEHPSFSGQRNNIEYSPGDQGIRILDTASEGIYEFASSLDLGDVFTVRLKSSRAIYALAGTALFDDASELFDNRPGVFDGAPVEDVRSQLEIRTSTDGSSWGEWESFEVGDYTFRYAEFRLKLVTSSTANNVLCDFLSVSVEASERSQSGTITTSNTQDTIFSYPQSFYQAPQLTFSIVNGATGDRIETVASDRAGFTINARNSSGSRVIRDVTFIAQGV
ncbi:MAG: phage tail protein [Cyanobacteria bacterium J06639_14]